MYTNALQFFQRIPTFLEYMFSLRATSLKYSLIRSNPSDVADCKKLITSRNDPQDLEVHLNDLPMSSRMTPLSHQSWFSSARRSRCPWSNLKVITSVNKTGTSRIGAKHEAPKAQDFKTMPKTSFRITQKTVSKHPKGTFRSRKPLQKFGYTAFCRSDASSSLKSTIVRI